MLAARESVAGALPAELAGMARPVDVALGLLARTLAGSESAVLLSDGPRQQRLV